MTRLRRKALVALFLFTLFIFGAMMGLRTLKPSDGFSDLAPGMDLAAESGDTKVVFTRADRDYGIFYDVHIFYYLWYGAPSVDNKYIHWDHVLVPHWDPKIAAGHAQGRHAPPEDIASSFYPELGPYSSRDQTVLESHMAQIEASAAGKRSRPARPPGFLPDGCCQPRLNNLPVRLVAPETLLSPDQPENRLLPAWFRLPLTQTTKAPVRSSRTPTWAGPEPVESQPVEGLADTVPPCWPPPLTLPSTFSRGAGGVLVSSRGGGRARRTHRGPGSCRHGCGPQAQRQGNW
ncbi:unnamed protein product [Tetraodon nigroviridis]|uniref:Chromosome undetermined SCAF14594, whole genome shotgun sequence n=1 Tax=Tetraodon nigroviridis TaxID=99883 RepID=Q4SGH4_TETNG|nr:unnamed protein product [Tetraodon nigroviridis]